MSNKLRLKEMSHKKLRKLVKKLGREIQKTTSDLKYVQSQYEARKLMEQKWKEQFEAEVYYKKQAYEENKKVREHNTKLKQESREWRVTCDKHLNNIAELEQAISIYKLSCERKDKRIKDLEDALDSLGSKQSYIGEMPANMTMGVDGQLREMTDEEHEQWVASEVARVQDESYEYPDWKEGAEYKEGQVVGYLGKYFSCIEDDNNSLVNPMLNKFWMELEQPESESQRVDMVGSIFGVPQGNGEIKPTELNTEPADVDAAVEWAKRNGHHQPEGNPEPDKMQNVRVKSADEISRENMLKHQEIADIGGHPRLP